MKNWKFFSLVCFSMGLLWCSVIGPSQNSSWGFILGASIGLLVGFLFKDLSVREGIGVVLGGIIISFVPFAILSLFNLAGF